MRGMILPTFLARLSKLPTWIIDLEPARNRHLPASSDGTAASAGTAAATTHTAAAAGAPAASAKG